MNAILWFLAIVGVYFVFVTWRTKLAVKSLTEDNAGFKTADIVERKEEEMPRGLRKLIQKNEADIAACGFKKFAMVTNRKFFNGNNFYVIYHSPDYTQFLSYAFMKVPNLSRFISLLTGDLVNFINAGMLNRLIETKYTDGTAVVTTDLKINLEAEYPRPAPWLKWVFFEQTTSLLEAYQKNEAFVSEYSKDRQRIVTPNLAEYQKVSDENRARLSKWNETELERFLESKNLSHLANNN